jgi:hypothetical protein
MILYVGLPSWEITKRHDLVCHSAKTFSSLFVMGDYYGETTCKIESLLAKILQPVTYKAESFSFYSGVRE